MHSIQYTHSLQEPLYIYQLGTWGAYVIPARCTAKHPRTPSPKRNASYPSTISKLPCSFSYPTPSPQYCYTRDNILHPLVSSLPDFFHHSFSSRLPSLPTQFKLHLIPLVVNHPAPLKQQAEQVDLRVLPAGHLGRPLLTFLGDPLGVVDA